MSAAQVLTDFENLPDHVKDKLAELDLELSEGRQCFIVNIFSSMHIHSDFQRTDMLSCPETVKIFVDLINSSFKEFYLIRIDLNKRIFGACYLQREQFSWFDFHDG